MPLQATSGAASYDGFGGGVAVVPTFIEDVFSCFLYTGTGASQTITNGIDLAGKGGLAWTKYRSGTNAAGHFLADSVRGIANTIQSNSEGDQQATSYYTAFNSNGFSISSTTEINYLNTLYASWTFRKQTKFFDIITYTGNGTSGTNIAHNLGSTPGCVMVKSTSTSRRWAVYHRGNGATPQNNFLCLNKAQASITSSVMWNNTAPTSTVFTLGSGTVVDAPTGEVTSTNENGVTYVAYLFAHDAGGFGLTGTDNVISCGSYTGVTYPNSLEVTLGFEPQFVIIKNSNTASDWTMWDIMRGMAVIPAANDAQAQILNPNNSAAESIQPGIFPTATGFVVKNGLTSISSPSDKMIYIAIRRGPMKVPTDGTTVFNPSVPTGFAQFTTGFPVDLGLWNYRTGYSENTVVNDRLRGVSTKNTSAFPNNLITSSTVAEQPSQGTQNWNNTGLYAVTSGAVFYSFRRAPSFFDEVCYTGTGSAMTVSHNLAAVPEMMIVKRRNSATYGEWFVYTATLGNAKYQLLNTTQASTTANSGIWNLSTPTSTIISVGSDLSFSASTYVAYLFATCAGVSKVGSYTGTGATQTINCGFGAGGSRFVLIKRTDSTGDWYVWDSARGMISGTDPSLLLNSTAAEVNANSVYAISTGFQIVSTAAGINASGGSYIFLSVA